MEEQLQKKILIEGIIRVETGLHIGGSNTAMSIGGMDNSVVRNPVTNKPYIPGSSLKGKMRSLIELSYGTIEEVNYSKTVKYGASSDYKTVAAKLFGTARNDEHQRPSRLIVRDAELTTPDEFFKNADMPYTEAKTEVVIDRITSGAMPRQMERVPAGAEFRLDMVLNIFQSDDENSLVEHVFKGLQLVQDDYLGGSGSRGYGKVKFSVSRVTERSAGYYKGQEPEKEYAGASVPDELKN